MRLYVINPSTQQKTYLNITAPTRLALARKIGYYTFSIDNIQYHVNNVLAEIEINTVATGAAVGGLVGTLGGPMGMLLGGIVGGIIGNANDEQKINQVRIFNQSRA